MSESDQSIAIINARVLTLTDGTSPRRGKQMSNLGAINNASILITGRHIQQVGTDLQVPSHARTIDANGRVVMPAFVDCHTHACWAGDRLDEWELKQRGATYLEILKSGGGIMSTVNAVRNASTVELVESLNDRLNWMLSEGTTACEVKSGYGLSTKDELKMLDAIHIASSSWEGRVLPTACIGHAKDASVADFVKQTIQETLPAVHEKYPSVTIDAYTEDGAWSVDETIALFEAAKNLGHPLRIHADQFNSLGMLESAIELGALSVDHLEATPTESLVRLAQSKTMGVMLPCSGFHVDSRYGDARTFINHNGALAIATNVNPGSAPCVSMPMSIAIAVRNLGITAAEAICASTINGAHLLGFEDLGSITKGNQADLVMLRHSDERQLGYSFGGNHTEMVICNGQIIR
ncbi:MAG: imidazolonepropionase [Phycisphaerales bacterium]|nr:imidazolonepropionase [Phycisphaerales bacterium]